MNATTILLIKDIPILHRQLGQQVPNYNWVQNYKSPWAVEKWTENLLSWPKEWALGLSSHI